MNLSLQRTLFVLACALSAAADVSAHAIGVSRGEYRLSTDGLSAELVFAQQEIAASLPEIDRDRDGRLSAAELQAGPDLFSGWLRRNLPLRAADESCASSSSAAELTDNDGLLVTLHYRCTVANEPQRLRFDLIDQLTPGHRHIATVRRSGGDATRVLYRSAAVLELESESGAQASTTSAGWPLVKLGVEHIATGYDHLVFLFGLILVAARLRSLIHVVTAFTLGHSITLAVATLGLWIPSASLVEPLIALSIVYVGIENLSLRDPSRRWPISLGFGLIHGFGFAGVLREIGLPQDDLPLALLSFNAGVEIGQLLILLAVLPLVSALRKRPWFARSGVHLLNAAIALAGAVWFVDRIA